MTSATSAVAAEELEDVTSEEAIASGSDDEAPATPVAREAQIQVAVRILEAAIEKAIRWRHKVVESLRLQQLEKLRPLLREGQGLQVNTTVLAYSGIGEMPARGQAFWLQMSTHHCASSESVPHTEMLLKDIAQW